MWDGDSAEAAACQASFQAADADALRLVVQHIYGCSVEVPVQLLPEVWRLADMFQVRGHAAGLRGAVWGLAGAWRNRHPAAFILPDCCQPWSEDSVAAHITWQLHVAAGCR
jgi:hypothetical protein